MKDHRGRTLLHYAAPTGNPEVVEWIMKKGVDANVRDNDGNTPLLLLYKTGVPNPYVEGFLAQFGADRTAENHMGESPRSMQTKIMRGWLDSKCNPQYKRVLRQALGDEPITEEEMDAVRRLMRSTITISWPGLDFNTKIWNAASDGEFRPQAHSWRV